MSEQNNTVGIIIPTMNRPEYVARQLRYYAKAKSPHTVYIDDASDHERADKLQYVVSEIKDKIKIDYVTFPKSDYITSKIRMLEKVKEPYVTYSADDDIQIPNGLTDAARFLGNNPDYATARGRAVTVRLDKQGPHGNITKISDYPQPERSEDSIHERLLRFLQNYYVTNFSVHHTEEMLHVWQQVRTVIDRSFAHEILPCCLDIIEGKSKTLDSLGFVRQIHDAHYELPSTFDWVISKDWRKTYYQVEDILTRTIALKNPGSDESESKKVIHQGFWCFLQKELSREYRQKYIAPLSKSKKLSFFQKLRLSVGKSFPFVKNIYKSLRPRIGNDIQMHYEVTRKGSVYYDDFQMLKRIIENT